MVNAITVSDTGTTIDLIEVGIQGPAGPAGATGATGPAGANGADGANGDTILGQPMLYPVLTSDLMPVVRGTTIYLARIVDILAALGPYSSGQLDFSNAGNSGLAAGAM
jgi:hypothetical protein